MNQYGGLQSVEQLYGDCYAHVSTTVILKLLKTLGIVEDVRNEQGKDQTYKTDLDELDSLEKAYIQAQIDDNNDLKFYKETTKMWHTIAKNIKTIFNQIESHKKNVPIDYTKIDYTKININHLNGVINKINDFTKSSVLSNITVKPIKQSYWNNKLMLWTDTIIDSYNQINEQLFKVSPFGISKRLSGIEEERVEIVGRNPVIREILASQTRYYRELYLFIIQHCGVNGGDYNAVFAWFEKQANSTDFNNREMCNNLKIEKGGNGYNLNDALNQFNDSNYTFNSEYTKGFIQTEVIDKIKAEIQKRGVKLQCILMQNDDKDNILTDDEVFLSEKTSGVSFFLSNRKTSDKTDCWNKIRALNTKKLYAALSINVLCNNIEEDLTDLTCINNGETNHGVTITAISDADITIKNSWGIREGDFGKRKIPLTAFGHNKRFGKFSISYIDIVDVVQPDLGVVESDLSEPQNAGKKYYQTKSRKNKGKKRKSKRTKLGNRSKKQVRK